MQRGHRGHDIYDDTGRRSYRRDRAPSRREENMRREERMRREHMHREHMHREHMRREQMHREHMRRDPMMGLMQRLEQDMFGFHNSMFSSMMGNFNDAFSGATASAGDGNSNYFYESKSRRIGPDGRVYEEVVRSNRGEDGRPRTHRIVRNPDGTREHTETNEAPRNPFAMFEDFGWPFGRGASHQQPPALPGVEIEELDGDYQENRVSRRRRRRSSRREEPVVEEPDNDPPVRPGDF